MIRKKNYDSDDITREQGTGRRRRSVMRAQKRAVAALLVCVLVLGVAVGVVSYYINRVVYTDTDGEKYYIKEKGGVYVACDSDGYTLDTTPDGNNYFSTKAGTVLKVDSSAGTYIVYAVPDTEEGEAVGSGTRILMFPQIVQDDIQSVRVHTATNDYTFYRNENDEFNIKGHENVAFDKALLAQLTVSCGYTLTMEKLSRYRDDGTYIELTEYGLDKQTRIDDEGNEYEYSPSWYTLVDTQDKIHTVYIGDMIPSGSGYYVRYSGRDAVYIMNYQVDASLISVYGQSTLTEDADSVFELPIETFITPTICYPMSLNTYFYIKNFSIFDGKELLKSQETEQLSVKPIVSYSYWDLDERTGTFYANDAYVMSYPENYTIDSNSAGEALQTFYSMSFLNVTKLGPTDEDMEKYGLDVPAYAIYFEYYPEGFSGEMWEHVIFVSEMTDRGTYYVTSAISSGDKIMYDYDMIVEIERTQMLFLNYKKLEWINSNYFSMNLAWATEIILETADGEYHFYLDNSGSDSVTNPTTVSDTAKSKGTITSDNMKLKAVAPDGTVMEALSTLTVTDASGFTWTINNETVKAVDANGTNASIRGAKYATNSRGEEVVVLVGSITDVNTGNKVEVGADTITVTASNGVVTTYLRCGMANFRKFYQTLLYASIIGDAHEGDMALTDDQITSYVADESRFQAKLTVLTSYDKQPKYEYSFYTYTERKSLININGETEFYVTRTFVDKIISDAAKVMTGEVIIPTNM